MIYRLLLVSLLFLSPALSSKEFKAKPQFYLPLAEKKVPVKIPKKSQPVIILDPGHGGTDEGAKIRTLLEKKLTLRASYLIKSQLELLGYQVILTRSRDIYTSLPRRVDIANGRKPSLFVSIHFNSSKSPIAKGIEVFYYQSKQQERAVSSKKLASSILKSIVAHTEALSRGVKQGNFHVIRETNMPAVLVEGGFLTNIEERSLLATATYLEKIAKGVAKGIDKYLKS